MRSKTIAAAGKTTFGANLRRARTARRLTLHDVAQAIGINTLSPISFIERSTRIPGPETIIKLAAAVQSTPAKLLRGVVTPYDALRGYTRRIVCVDTNVLTGMLADDEREFLDAWRGANPKLKRLIAAMLRELGPALDDTERARATRQRTRAASRRQRGVAAPSESGEAGPLPEPNATDAPARVARRA